MNSSSHNLLAVMAQSNNTKNDGDNTDLSHPLFNSSTNNNNNNSSSGGTYNCYQQRQLREERSMTPPFANPPPPLHHHQQQQSQRQNGGRSDGSMTPTSTLSTPVYSGLSASRVTNTKDNNTTSATSPGATI